jgi:hypothetical protein
MTRYTHRVAMALRDDRPTTVGDVDGEPRTRLELGGLLAYTLTAEPIDLDCWERSAPEWLDAEGYPYRVMDAQMRDQDVAALPGFLAIVCQDADPSTLIATATEGRAYDADGVLLGAYTDYTEGSGRDALAALGLAPPTPEI